MKRAKFVLSAVAILAVVGGALAFKARNTDHLYFSTIGSPLCTVESIAVSTSFAANQAPVTTDLVPLAEESGPCTTTTLYYTAQ